MQRRLSILLFSCAVSTLCAAPVAAQDQGDTGITMGYPASLGFIYHVTARFAVRPELSFSRGETEIEQLFGETESSIWSVGLGVSGLFYIKEWDRVRAYVSPRYAYSRNRSTSELALTEQSSTTTTTVHLFMGAFGAQYAPTERFSVFGEVGLGYNSQRVRSNLSSTRADARTVSSRTGVGIVFYF